MGEQSDLPIVVVGAGLAGLVAANELVRAGRRVFVVDKGPSVGGRLATRRVVDAVVDHGAQFFTVRSDRFAAFVDPLVADGTVFEWCRGFGEIDGYPRYATAGGMNQLAKTLARGLDVRVGVELRAVRAAGTGWELAWDGGSLDASSVVLTPPVPQSLALLSAGGVATAAELADISYHRVLAVLAVLDGPSGVPDPGARQLASGPFSFVADNALKGISPRTAVTLHAAHDLSGQRWDDDPDTVLRELLAEGADWLGGSPVATAQLKRWRYSGPRQPWPDSTCEAAPGVFLAGDAFAGPKVEGAFLSGVAAAAAVLAR